MRWGRLVKFPPVHIGAVISLDEHLTAVNLLISERPRQQVELVLASECTQLDESASVAYGSAERPLTEGCTTQAPAPATSSVV